MIEYLLFSNWIDDDDPSRLVLPVSLLWEQIYPNHWGHKSATKIRAEFETATGILLNAQDGAIDLSSCGSGEDNRATTVSPLLPMELRKAKQALVLTPLEDRSVYFISGLPVTTYRERRRKEQARKDMLSIVKSTLDEMGDPTCAAKLELLNNQFHAARLLERTIPELKALVAELDALDAVGEKVDKLKDYTLTTLDAIEQVCSVVYKPNKYTPRLFPTGCSLLQLPRSLRMLALAMSGSTNADVIECDLTYVHLAIVARLWGLPATTELLTRCRETGTSIWTELYAYLHLDQSYKPILKKTLYSICYGMCRNTNNKDDKGNLRPCLRRQFLDGVPDRLIPIKGVNDPKAWTRFAKHPAIAELLKARKEQIAQVETDGGRHDAWGRWIAISDPKTGKLKPKSILSYVSQSYEQEIMGKLIERLKSCKQTYVLCYAHDGLTLLCSDRSRTKAHIAALQQSVANVAAGMNILTGLEVQELQTAEMLAIVEQMIGDLESCSPASAALSVAA